MAWEGWQSVALLVGFVGSLTMAFAPKIANALLSRDEQYRRFSWQTSAGDLAKLTLQEGYATESALLGQVQRLAAERRHAERTSEFVEIGALLLAAGFLLQVFFG